MPIKRPCAFLRFPSFLLFYQCICAKYFAVNARYFKDRTVPLEESIFIFSPPPFRSPPFLSFFFSRWAIGGTDGATCRKRSSSLPPSPFLSLFLLLYLFPAPLGHRGHWRLRWWPPFRNPLGVIPFFSFLFFSFFLFFPSPPVWEGEGIIDNGPGSPLKIPPMSGCFFLFFFFSLCLFRSKGAIWTQR